MTSPPLSISTTPRLSGSVSIPDAATGADFRLDAVDKSLLKPPCFFWESPQGECVSLIGAAARREFAGPEPWSEAKAWVRGIADWVDLSGGEQGLPPLAFGGFSFDGGPAVGWGLPAGMVIVPAIQWHRDAEGRTTLASWVEADLCFGAARPARTVRPASARALEPWAPMEWARAVGWALDRIRTGDVEKVVLARSREARAPRRWDPVRAFTALREEYPSSFRFLFLDDSGGFFLGASPERLVSLRRGEVRADAVAGTALLDGEEADAAAPALLEDAKERREHDVVVREILAALRAVCPDASAPTEPEVLRFRRLAHLRTPVTASAPPGIHVLDLVSRLHPTPAVAGTPRDEALKLIRVLEPRGRGWYAGPVGWMTPEGEGDFAVGIRSAFVRDRSALFCAGAGIVAGSQPAREWDECEAKLRSIEDVLLRD